MTRILTTLAALAVVSLPLAASGEPFAPTASVPRGVDNPAMKQMFAEVKERCPEKAEVEAPAYPKAVAVGQTPKQGAALANVTLMSNDDAKKVAAWYESNLEGWKTKEQFGSIFFWKGDDADFAFMGAKVPHVVIVELPDEAVDRKIHPEGKTHITVWYGSKK